MISFYPGPSRVYSQIPAYVQDAYEAGLLSINHRSAEFMEMSANAIRLLREKLEIPEDYWVFFTASATECWEIISQSLVRKKSYHLYNGAFGEKWWQYAQKIQPQVVGKAFSLEETLQVAELKVDEAVEVICITQNETSNGTAVSNATIREIREKYPEKLIAIDATSSMAGVFLDFSTADVWFASVQKCFGLPAGMGIMICSSKAIDTALEIGENNHYNSLVFMIEKMRDYQTTHTPNVLSIYLLMRTLEKVSSIHSTDAMLQSRFETYMTFFSTGKNMECLIHNPEVRSKTVITLQAEAQRIREIKAAAKKAGILLGNGYGGWKENTFRIANFPAIEKKEIEILKNFLEAYL
jgi:phosphoserine aminotransferase